MTAEREFTRTSIPIALAAFSGALFNASLIAAICTGVFLSSMTSELGWSSAEIGAGVTFNFWGMAVGAALAGRFVDGFGARALILPCALLSGALLASIGLAGSSKLLYYASFFFLGMSVPGAVGYSKLLSGWFFRRRGLALAGLGVGIFLATIVVPPLANILQAKLGWRLAFACMGFAVIFILFPIIALFARERPGHRSDDKVRDDVDGAPAMTGWQIWKSPFFWLLAIALLGSRAASGVFMVHAIGILTEQGLSRTQAIAGMSAIGMGGLMAQLATGWLVDHFNSPRVLVPIAATSLLGVLLIHMGWSVPIVLAGGILFGVGAGGEDSVMSYLITRFFGVRNFARAYGSLMPLITIGAAPAPILAGMVLGYTHSYQPALILMEIALALGVPAFLFLREFPFPSRSDAVGAIGASANPATSPSLVTRLLLARKNS